MQTTPLGQEDPDAVEHQIFVIHHFHGSGSENTSQKFTVHEACVHVSMHAANFVSINVTVRIKFTKIMLFENLVLYNTPLSLVLLSLV